MAQRMSKRLQKEYEAIQKANQELKVVLPNNDLAHWQVNFPGAKGTLYEGEHFTLQLRFSNEYVLHTSNSLSSRQKSSSLATFPSTNTFIRMDSSAYRFSTIVNLLIF